MDTNIFYRLITDEEFLIFILFYRRISLVRRGGNYLSLLLSSFISLIEPNILEVCPTGDGPPEPVVMLVPLPPPPPPPPLEVHLELPQMPPLLHKDQ